GSCTTVDVSDWDLIAASCIVSNGNCKTQPGLFVRGALWNSFVMVFRLRRMLELLHQVRPAGTSRLARLLDDPDALVAAYPSIAPWNFSRDSLAPVPEHLAVVCAADVGWSDWGPPEAIEQTLA